MIKKFSCPRCKNIDVYTDMKRGDVICVKCGEIIVSRIIDESSEWNEYLDDDRERGDYLARSDAYVKKNNIFECETSMIGGNNEIRKTLLKTQNMMELKINKKVIGNIDMMWQIGIRLKLSQSIQVSEFDLLYVIIL